MHLSDERFAAEAADARAMRPEEAAHLASCAACTERLEAMRREYREVDDLLRLLDDPSPRVNVDRVIAVARRRRWIAARPIAAGIALTVAAAAAAMPGSPVRAAITRVLSGTRNSPSVPAPTVADDVRSATGAGIAIVPGPELDIVFRERQKSGELRITVSDAAQLSIVPRGGNAAFAIGRGRIAIDNRGPAASYSLEVPRTMQRVHVRVDSAIVFRMSGGVVSTRARPDSTGVYSIDLSAPNPARDRRP